MNFFQTLLTDFWEFTGLKILIFNCSCFFDCRIQSMLVRLGFG